MNGHEALEQIAPCCTYDGLAEIYKTTFAKITKSSPEIAELCMEQHYIDYTKGGLIVDERPDGHGFLTFIPVDKIVLAMPHGDKYTELETNAQTAKYMCPNNPVRDLGGAFHEFVAPKLLVRKNISLDNINLQRRLIGKAEIPILYAAATPFFEFSRHRTHFARLGLTNAAALWHDIEQDALRMKKDKLTPVQIGVKLKEEYGIPDRVMNKEQER